MLPPRSSLRERLLKLALWAAIGAVVLAFAIQFVPYGLNRTPVPAPRPFQWRSPAAEALARAACYDCHSNETRVWWAVKVAPFSWLARSDVQRGQRHLDFSNWNGRLTAPRLQRALDRGMAPWYYTIAHPEARLSDAQKQVLVQGFQASLGANASAGPASAPGAEAAALIRTRCSSCHSPTRALDFRTANPDLAKALVDRMVRHGARLPAGAEPVLIKFFTS